MKKQTKEKETEEAVAAVAPLVKIPEKGALPPEVFATAKLVTAMDREKSEEVTSVRDKMFERSMTVVDAALRFSELNPEDNFAAHRTVYGDLVPPAAWVEEMGEEKAMVTMRTAMAAWERGQDAPTALKLAANVAVGITKAMAAEKGHNRPLNIAMITLPRADDKAPVFEEVVIDVEE